LGIFLKDVGSNLMGYSSGETGYVKKWTIEGWILSERRQGAEGITCGREGAGMRGLLTGEDEEKIKGVSAGSTGPGSPRADAVRPYLENTG
jgi:hypothetical protein